MSDKSTHFWQLFHKGDLDKALEDFVTLEQSEQVEIFQGLFQKSGNSRKPFIVSVLKRKLHDDQSFNDFYGSWFPEKESCQPVIDGGETYQQHFPVSTRVLNGKNIDDQQNIISIGLTWVRNEEEEKSLMEYIKKANNGDDPSSKARHEKIDEVANGELVGLFKVETDDNLGSPF